MSLITEMRKQKALWWRRLGADRYGKFSYAAPVEIDCRWDECMKEYRNAQGEKETSAHVAYVDRVMSLGDKLKLGEEDSNTPDDPNGHDGIFEISGLENYKDFDNVETLRIVYMGGKK